MDYEKCTLIWHPLTPDDVPPVRTPVLLKLRVPFIPAQPRKNGDVVAPDARAQLERGTFYGYATAVLAYTLDGFERPVLKGFALLELNIAANEMGCARYITFDRVEAWAAL